ncbi:MAG: hypothetical protein M0Z87_11455 [Actinomycetota bacterium]|nr:hypothetical protein [Actinomycetota bacterium]
MKLPLSKRVTTTAGILQRLPGGNPRRGRHRSQHATRPVELTVVGAPFERAGRRLPSDLPVTPTIVAGAPITVAGDAASAASAGAAVPSSPRARMDRAHAAAGPAALPRASAFRTFVTSPLPRRMSGKVHPARRSFTPPLPAPQGGRWYGDKAIFAAPASGVYRYLASGPLHLTSPGGPHHVACD